MSYLVIKKNNLKMVNEISIYDHEMRQHIINIMGHDYDIYRDANVNVFYEGMEYQGDNSYFKICATLEEAEIN